jgi:NADH:ubiquinone oxidoreductase subunit H
LHNILLSNMINIFFFGGWISPFFILSSFLLEDFFLLSLKSSFWIYFVFFIRGVFLRYRYDQLMFLNWSFFVPVLIYSFFFLFLFLFLL